MIEKEKNETPLLNSPDRYPAKTPSIKLFHSEIASTCNGVVIYSVRSSQKSQKHPNTILSLSVLPLYLYVANTNSILRYLDQTAVSKQIPCMSCLASTNNLMKIL